MTTRPRHPAFPVGAEPVVSPADEINDEGLTKREYFAALALQGLVTRNALPAGSEPRLAVEKADALIAALNGQESTQGP